MEKFGVQAESRVLFGYEDRKAVLKSSYGICAHCGKKLTTKTMTIEHIIPLSRGGANDPENLVALCYDCNQKKGNMLPSLRVLFGPAGQAPVPPDAGTGGGLVCDGERRF